MSKVIVSLSGGMDSATLLAKAVAAGHSVECVGMSYGSKHGRYEQECARRLCLHYGVPYRLVDLTEALGGLLSSDLLKTGGDVPEGHYEAESMRRTVVPGRNIIFASILAGRAWSAGADEVWLGVHAGDHFIYPDCRPQFFYAMRAAVREGTDGRVVLQAPFLHVDKAAILKEGLTLGAPYQLTRTCYKDQSVACGRCGSCQERLWSFRQNGVEDPLEYASRELIPKEST